MASDFRVLVLGDIIGKPGCRALFVQLKTLIKDFSADSVIVNGENAADGFGLLPETAEQIFSSGADVITSGNHIWQKQEILGMLDQSPRLLRPENYPPGVPGHGFTVTESKNFRLGVLNLQGRESLPSTLCPFRTAAEVLRKRKEEYDAVVIDFHAEYPGEKEALAHYLDGKVSAVLGTHTHVQTADERILAGGTAYITDIGMCGPKESVIGVEVDTAVQRSLTQMPLKMSVADLPADLQGVLISIDKERGTARSIERIRFSSTV
ncbi:MAG: TIGR00282 family metallophosphoesterase [Spirochaetales bacterium]|nr:TIGR00282 family metallophosphoesterase [Spirochaetales bacterium]MCF7939313.1 TIGR00282 family metallophosphoesterase [Spirochaetales bacterium]